MKVWMVLLIILIVLVIVFVVLYFVGKRAQKKQEKREEQLAENAQTYNILIIDKKRMPVKKSGLPQQVIAQTPKLLRRSKLPIVKAKVGPKVMTLIADEKIYEEIPVKTEVRATLSGLYITGVRGVRKPLDKPVKKKKGLRAKLMNTYNKAAEEVKENKAEKAKYEATRAKNKAKAQAAQERARAEKKKK